MMKIGLKIVLLFSFIALVAFACKRKDNVPDEPQIIFKDFLVLGDSAKLIIKFTDGDGDLGLSDSDTEPPYDFNTFITYYEKQNGTFVARDLPFPFNYRIPVLNNSGRKKELNGELQITIAPTYYDPFSSYDTIKYSIYIQDKALNKSNVIETNEIVVPR
ncbi:MAG: hypothetical protein V4667_02130 [Bacteroidota bacterium]